MIAATLRVSRTREPLAESVDLLADVGAVEVQRVVAALAVDGVAAVARDPTGSVSLPAPSWARVGADVAVDEVVAAAAEQHVGAVAAAQGVVAGAAVDGEVRQRADAVLAGDRVGAAEARDDEAPRPRCCSSRPRGRA